MSKKDGTIYECVFKVEAMKHGNDVFPSEGDYSVVDMVVLNPAGRAFRVQIKGTALEGASDGASRPPMKNKFKICIDGERRNTILATEVDVLACYISPRDTWYLIPMVKAVGLKTLAFFLQEDSESKWQAYRNNWDIFLQ
jgi:hypothetical protein